MSLAATTRAGLQADPRPTLYRILFAVSLVHLFNDSIQSVIASINPILKTEMGLTYTQIGLVGFMLNFTASIMQPVVGLYTDAKPSPYLLPLGMVSTFLGMLTLAFATSYPLVLLSVFLVGIGSAVFHPEGSRVASMAAGSRRGLAQSIYQVGGNAGQALAPLMTIFIFYKLGLRGAIWFTLVAGAAIAVQYGISVWYRGQLQLRPKKAKNTDVRIVSADRKRRIAFAMTMLLFFVFARSWYGACISNFYAFYAIDHFHLADESHAQLYIFLFLAAGAVGTFFGGPLSDRFGRRNLIFFSMLGSAPFALILPYAGPQLAFWLLTIMGFILLSSFSVTVVYAQDLLPGKVGTVSGLVIGLAFGLGALGAVSLGSLADNTSPDFVLKLCSFLPLFGLVTFFLPSDTKLKEWAA
jgi:MFS transporter, FSR family, fosmidomycin resistance protein